MIISTQFKMSDNEYENEYVYANEEGEMSRPEMNLLARAEYFAEDDINIGAEALRDPVQRFTAFVKLVATNMVEQNIIKLNRREISFLITQSKNVASPGYKNPTGFVLGYWVIKNNAINEKRLQNISPKLSSLDYPIRLYDVVRYARLWKEQNLTLTI